MFEDTVFPDWLAPFLVSDDLFGVAYEATEPERRAWLKSSIARLFAMHGASSETWGRHERQWRQGFVTVAECQPVAWTVIVISQDYVSAPRLLAGLMPALLAGVRNILVVRVGDSAPWPDPILAALELAGQEAVVNLSEERLLSLFSEMQGQGAGRWVFLGSLPHMVSACHSQQNAHIAVWTEPVFTAIGVATGQEIDVDLLAWAHPDMKLVSVNVENADPDDFTGFSGCEAFAAFVGDPEVIDLVPDSVPLMLGPGQEGCWIWPDLEPSFFLQRRLALVTEM